MINSRYVKVWVIREQARGHQTRPTANIQQREAITQAKLGQLAMLLLPTDSDLRPQPVNGRQDARAT